MKKIWLIALTIIASLALGWCTKDDQITQLESQNTLLQQQILTLETKIKDQSALLEKQIIPDIKTMIASGDVIGSGDTLSIEWPNTLMVENKIVSTGSFSKTYTSKSLGFELNLNAYSPNNTYNNNQDNDYVYFIKSSNRLNIISARSWIESPKSIERIAKGKTETVAQAIKRLFLAKIDKKCTVKPVDKESNLSYPGFIISYDWKLKEGENIFNFCWDHGQTNGVNFFLGQDNSDHFYYIMAGQDPYLSKDWQIMWYNTLKLF